MSTKVGAKNTTLQMDSIKQTTVSHHLLQDDNHNTFRNCLHQTLSKVHICIEKCMSSYDLQMAKGHVNAAAHILELAQTASKCNISS